MLAFVLGLRCLRAVCECSFSRCLVYTVTLLVLFPPRGYRIKPTHNQKKIVTRPSEASAPPTRAFWDGTADDRETLPSMSTGRVIHFIAVGETLQDW